MKDQLTTLDFSQCLWQLFLALISATIDTFRKRLGEMAAIDNRMEEFFVLALQLDVFTLEMEFE